MVMESGWSSGFKANSNKKEFIDSSRNLIGAMQVLNFHHLFKPFFIF